MKNETEILESLHFDACHLVTRAKVFHRIAFGDPLWSCARRLSILTGCLDLIEADIAELRALLPPNVQTPPDAP